MLAHCPKPKTAIASGLVDPTRAVPLPVKSGGVVVRPPGNRIARLAGLAQDVARRARQSGAGRACCNPPLVPRFTGLRLRNP